MTDYRHEAPAEGAGEREALAAIMHRNMIPDEDGGFSFHDLKAADQIMDYLRARSSAPEAREGEAVAWRRRAPSNNQWTLFDDAKDADFYRASGRYTVEPLYAAPSADKLRIAVEAIWEIAGGRATDGHNEAGRLGRIKDRAAEALAALKGDA